VIVNGQQRDPRLALKASAGEPIPASEQAAFQQLRDKLLASIDAPITGVAKLGPR
jgi:hypothetical protein